jgi:hypothetical protein
VSIEVSCAQQCLLVFGAGVGAAVVGAAVVGAVTEREQSHQFDIRTVLTFVQYNRLKQ